MSKSRMNVIYLVFAALVTLLGYQNCTSRLSYSGNSSISGGNGNGDGYGGMTRYFYFDKANACSAGADGQPTANAEIDIFNQKSAQLVRTSCADLNPPQALDLSQLQPSSDGTGDIIYIGLTFVPQAYYVATNGNDSNSGTSVSMPLLTLEKAQSLMQSSGIHTTYVRAGSYNITSPLTLTSADSGERWSFYSADGVNSAVLDGGDSVDIININGGSNIVVNGLKLQNFNTFGVHIVGGGPPYNLPVAAGNTVMNCDIGSNVVASVNSGAVFAEGATPNTNIKNNYVHDLTGMGLALITYWSANDSIDGSTIENNVIFNTAQKVNTSSAIEIVMRYAGINHVMVQNNFVRDYSGSGITSASAVAINNNSNNVTAIGNIIGPPKFAASGTAAFAVTDGHDNHISGNIIDLGSTGMDITALWDHTGSQPVDQGMAGNTFIGNIVISGFAGNQNTNFFGVNGFSYYDDVTGTNTPTIQNNIYWNYGGGVARTDGNHTSDSNPHLEDPLVSGWIYQLSASSPAFSAPVNFAGIAGGWGPPGFSIPQTGTAPSAP